MKQGLTPLWNDDMVEDFFDRFIDRAEEQILKHLSAAGEKFVATARKSGNYNDQTGNLRSSIGYIIVKDGDVISENYQLSEKGTDRYTGLKQGQRLIKEIAEAFPNGYILIGVAGMEYAACVEAGGRDVVSGACIQCEDYLRRASKRIFDRIYGRI